MRTILLAVISGVALAGCSASPFDTRGETGRQVGSDRLPQSHESAPKVLWGGQIVDATQTESGTRLEVRAHRLGLGDRPVVTADTGLHFMIDHPETLDLREYRPGRFLTAMGGYAEIDTVRVADDEFTVPVMKGEQIELWSSKVYPDSLRPITFSKEMRSTSWYPAMITPSTATAGSVSSGSAGPN